MNLHALAAEVVDEPLPGIDNWFVYCEAVESTTDVLRRVVGREVRDRLARGRPLWFATGPGEVGVVDTPKQG